MGKVTDPLSWTMCSAQEVKPDLLTVNTMTSHYITAIFLQELCVKVSVPMNIHTCRNTFMHACTHTLHIHMHTVRVLQYYVIGASVSKPHTSVFSCDFSWYVILSVVHRSVKQGDTLLTRNIAHADYTWNIGTQTFSVLCYKLF